MMSNDYFLVFIIILMYNLFDYIIEILMKLEK